MNYYSAMEQSSSNEPKMPRKQSSIWSTLDQLDKAIAGVSESADGLIDPLIPVLAGGDPRNTPEIANEGLRASANCLMDERLVLFVLRLGEINSRLAGLKAQIQL